MRRETARWAERSSPARAAAVARLEVVELGLERLDGAVRGLEVLVETVALGDELEMTSLINMVGH